MAVGCVWLLSTHNYLSRRSFSPRAGYLRSAITAPSHAPAHVRGKTGLFSGPLFVFTTNPRDGRQCRIGQAQDRRPDLHAGWGRRAH